LGAAWALHDRHTVTVFEADDRAGGHSNTVDIMTAAGPIPVDTGFIVFNQHTYPYLTRLFEALEVSTEPSDMSFSFSLDGELEYRAGNVRKPMLFCPSQMARPTTPSRIRDDRHAPRLRAAPGKGHWRPPLKRCILKQPAPGR